jgi:hypothetical protein
VNKTDRGIYYFDAGDWGPFPCDVCTGETCTIRLTEKEYKQIKDLEEKKKFPYIYKNNLGKGVCRLHF